MNEFINLTPHEIVIVGGEGEVIARIAPEPTPARCTVQREVAFDLDGIAVNRSVFGEVFGLPEQKAGVWLIVSRIVAEAAKRNDLLVPDETVRDQRGQIVGCKSFAVV